MTDPTTTPTPPQGLTDAQLLELAAREIEPYDRIPPGEYEAEYQRALEVYGSELIAAMRAAIAAHEAALAAERPQPVPGWQSNDTAPHDGTEILASDYDTIEILSWNSDAWGNRDGSIMFPAWWQPLPEQPRLPQPPQGGEVEV